MWRKLCVVDWIVMTVSKGQGALHPLLMEICVGTVPPAGNQQAGGPGAEGGEMSRVKCKSLLTSGAENMFCATRGTLVFHKVK